MGSECRGLMAAPAPAQTEAAPVGTLRMRGPEGLSIEVAGDATVADVRAAVRAAGRPARALTFCDEPLDASARLVDLAIYDDAEFGIAPCQHWRLRLERHGAGRALHCLDCEEWAEVHLRGEFAVELARMPRMGFFYPEERPHARRYRGPIEEVASSMLTMRTSGQPRPASAMLAAWRAARSPEALTACLHPVGSRPSVSRMTCSKCRQACERVMAANLGGERI